MPEPGTDGTSGVAGIEPGWKSLLDAAALPAFLTDARRDGEPVVYANSAFLALSRRAEDEVCGRPIASLWPGAVPGEGGSAAEFLAQAGDGSTFWASLTLAPVAGTPFRLGQIVDVTRRRDFEGALALSRQREALGLLTNSVAHEFNNFLQILIGYIDGLKRRLGDRPEPFIQRAVTRSTDAAERAAVLTRQLLAFSRRIAPEVRPVDLDAVVAEIAGRLRISLPASIALTVETTPDLPRALSNPTQLELALAHIVANACEAMPRGGTITIATFLVPVGDRTIQRPADGAVGVSVSDTGTGMSQEMLARALAPFATSREAGRGAGLAIVHGLMKRQNGTVALDSRQGEGTSVRLIFPAAA
ncbi:ATP-binding protein [Methylobacterium oxalidis]|uniref:ATP-binding protein n=1 Tax=Methylobacterium oxalidis TaxID=944322 RepID=UPI0011BE98E4|nr:ATP-binding protein [Methylobacterium oxalidis]GJE30985.1 Blue-light-activated protein [Methylobacterium oxalidis]